MRHRLKSLALVVLLGAAGAVWLSAAQEKRKGRRRRRPAPRAAPRRAAAVVLSGGLRTFLHCNGSFFDRVVAENPDFASTTSVLCSSVNLTAALAVLDEDVVLVPFAEDQLVFDQFAVAGPDAMARYARAYADTLTREIARNPQRALYPEREMWRHFRAEKLKAVTLREFRSTLVRLDGAGAPRHEDAYAKLRLDYPHLARVAMPAVDGATCAPRKKRRGG
ncbi:hypothetical protein JL722_12340 [Aureococcus anophagefferens]|nr:hypothetical protein JL722_12340 [Aureococcus anophagefferens]